MSSNYEWQKFQAGERVQARLREAKAHRQVRRENPHPARALPFSVALLFGIALVVWLLAGCTSAAPVTAAPANGLSRAETVGPAAQLPEPDPGADHKLRVTIGRERVERAEVPASEGGVDNGIEGRVALLQMARVMKPLSSVSIRALRTEGSGHLACTYGEASWVDGRPPDTGSTTNVRFVIVWRQEAGGPWRVALEMLAAAPT